MSNCLSATNGQSLDSSTGHISHNVQGQGCLPFLTLFVFLLFLGFLLHIFFLISKKRPRVGMVKQNSTYRRTNGFRVCSICVYQTKNYRKVNKYYVLVCYYCLVTRTKLLVFLFTLISSNLSKSFHKRSPTEFSSNSEEVRLKFLEHVATQGA